METKRYLRLFWWAVLPWVMAGCAPQRMAGPVTVSPVATLTPDSLSQVCVDTRINIPRNLLSSRGRLIVRPRLMQGEKLVAECPLLVLDAPIFAEKMERRRVLSGYVDSLAGRARRVEASQPLVLPYRTTVSVPDHFDGGRIVALVSTSGCGRCSALDTVEVAAVSNLTTLIEPRKELHLNWIEPEFVIRPKIVKGRGEARLQFVINRYDIDLALGNNRREMDAMLATLDKIVGDSLMTLDTLGIYGMASADGAYAYNTMLARNRAASAKRWLVSRLGLPADRAALISTGARPEGWGPVLEAMRADGNPDTLAVAAILARCNAENDDAAEARIRRLACWPEIRAKYLQKDRKVEYEYTYTIRSFTTDRELLAMYDRRPDAFNEEELLRVTTLMPDAGAKQAVYRTILHYFPQSEVAANNLAVLLLREGRGDEAEAVLDSLGAYSPEMINTKAAIHVYRHDYERAVELLRKGGSLPEARYNLGLLMAELRRLDEAYELLKGYSDTNVAVVALSVGRNDEAARIMAACDDRTPRAEYVRALIAARQGDADGVVARLTGAVSDRSLRRRAADEADFRPYALREDFVKLVNRDESDE